MIVRIMTALFVVFFLTGCSARLNPLPGNLTSGMPSAGALHTAGGDIGEPDSGGQFVIVVIGVPEFGFADLVAKFKDAVVGTNQNGDSIEVYSTKTGKLIESIPIPAGFQGKTFNMPSSAYDPAGNIFFELDGGDPTVGKVDLATKAFSFFFARASLAGGVVVSTDGNLYFPDLNLDVEKIDTTTGVATVLAHLPNSSYARCIAPDANGNLYVISDFTDHSHSYVNKITLAGVLTQWTVPVSTATGHSITRGPDGNMWALSGNSVFKVTPGGAFTVYPLSSGIGESAGCSHITVGQRNNLWFSTSANSIGSVTTTGTATFYTLPASETFFTRNIAYAGDGNLWITGGYGNSATHVLVYLDHKLSLVPTSLTFSGIGQTKSFAVSETNYSGKFKVSTTNAAVATVAPGPDKLHFKVTSVGTGTCKIVVSAGLNSTKLPVTVQ